MGITGKPYLVPQPLRGYDGDLVTYSLIGLEVESEFGVVALDDDFGRLFHSLQARSPESANPSIHPRSLNFFSHHQY